MNGKLHLFIVLVVFYSQMATASKCWSCSSDKLSEKFCDDPFSTKKWKDEYEEECGGAYSWGKTMVCRKLIEEFDGLKITRRDCYEQNLNVTKSNCVFESRSRHFNVLYCETCTTDGCNGAEQHGPIASLVVFLSVVIKKIIFL